MTWNLTLYTRKDCCLCEEMKEAIQEVATEAPVALEEIDVDSAPDLREKYGAEVPVLFINGRKAFKYKATVRELRNRFRSGAV